MYKKVWRQCGVRRYKLHTGPEAKKIEYTCDECGEKRTVRQAYLKQMLKSHKTRLFCGVSCALLNFNKRRRAASSTMKANERVLD